MSTIEDRRMEDNVRRAEDKCTCGDPWRFNSKKLNSDIEEIKEGTKVLWGSVNTMVTVRTFWGVLSLLTAMLLAVCSTLYDTNKQTLQIVTTIQSDIIVIKSQQEIINKLLPHM